MGNLLRNLPKNVLAILVVTLGTAFIVLSQPPHTVCESQLEQIRESQKAFLFRPAASKVRLTTQYEILRDRCKASNNPGGCYELFQRVKKLLSDLETLTRECVEAGNNISEVKRTLWDTAELMVRLAWSEKPPTTYSTKFNWLDVADVSLFCRLRTRISSIYGESSWESFRERMMRDLPGAKDLARNQVWEFTLFSENCARYP